MMREPSCSPTSHCTTRPETSKSSNLIKRSLPYSMVEKRCATSLSCLYHQYHQYYRSSHRSFLGFSQLRDVYACNNNEIHHIFSSREYLERSWPRAFYDTQFTTVETCDRSFGRVVHEELAYFRSHSPGVFLAVWSSENPIPPQKSPAIFFEVPIGPVRRDIQIPHPNPRTAYRAILDCCQMSKYFFQMFYLFVFWCDLVIDEGRYDRRYLDISSRQCWYS